jgi:hypothetical protein
MTDTNCFNSYMTWFAHAFTANRQRQQQLAFLLRIALCDTNESNNMHCNMQTGILNAVYVFALIYLHLASL